MAIGDGNARLVGIARGVVGRVGVVDVGPHRVEEGVDRARIHHHYFVLHQWNAKDVEAFQQRVGIDLVGGADLRAHRAEGLVVNGGVGVVIIDIGIGMILGKADVQLIGNKKLIGAGDADVGENDLLIVEGRRLEPKKAGGFVGDEDSRCAGVEKCLDVEGSFKLLRRAAGRERNISIDARLIERGRHDALVVGGESRRQRRQKRGRHGDSTLPEQFVR